MGTSNELKSKAMDYLVMAHGLRHENMNPLIGEYCTYSSRINLSDISKQFKSLDSSYRRQNFKYLNPSLYY